MAAAKGNQYAAKERVWTAAILRVLDKRTKSRADKQDELELLAGKLLDAASTSDMTALKELGDRLEGKPAQSIVGADGNDLRFELVAPWMKEVLSKRGLG